MRGLPPDRRMDARTGDGKTDRQTKPAARARVDHTREEGGSVAATDKSHPSAGRRRAVGREAEVKEGGGIMNILVCRSSSTTLAGEESIIPLFRFSLSL